MSAQIEFVLSSFGTNSYVIGEAGKDLAVVVDPGTDLVPIENVLSAHGWKANLILLTHGHLPQVARSAEAASRWGAKVGIHSADLVLLQRLPRLGEQNGLCGIRVPHIDQFLTDGQSLAVGSMMIQVLETPGHTEGSLTFRVGEAHFVGDLWGESEYQGQDCDHQQKETSFFSLLHNAPPKSRFYPSYGTSLTLEGILSQRGNLA